MAYLETIVRHLEEIFDIKIEGQWNGRTRIEGIRFLACEQDRAGQGQTYMGRTYGGQAQDLEGQLLYISDSKNELPARRPRNLLMVGLCEPLPDPHIIYIREQIGLAQLFNAVQEVIFMHNAQKLKQEELFRSLHSGHGIEGLAHVAHAYLGNPVTICDTSFSIIAASPVVEDADNLEKKHGRLYLKDALFQNMEDRKIIRHIYSSSAPYVTTLDDYPYKWVFESIRIRHAVVGYVCVRGTVREFTEDDLELYGKYKAKFSDAFMNSLDEKPDGKLVLMTAINPTPAGEGKTTTSIGLAQALEKLGKKSVLALREPSLGPCFGIKGGAAGGGYSQVVPMEDLNLHFTGDFHAITSANNLLAALLDNHIQQGNELRIDTRQVIWKRCMDMNDRSLRNIVIGLGRKVDGYVREDHFVITVATEIMAILCLAEDIKDLKERLSKIIVAYDVDGNPVTAGQLNAVGSMAALLKDAIKPNMVQTLEHTGAIVHGGPFANIAHGCNSVRATKMALKLSDIAITEAGFGADLGAEKFMDIKCRMAGLKPDAVVLVATVRALKYNGGVPKTDLAEENMDALKKGICNLEKHIENLQKFGVPIVVTLNAFVTDTEAEHDFIRQFCEERGCEFALSEVWAKGGEGGIELAKKVLKTLEEKESNFKVLYPDNAPLKEKVETIAKEIYGADGVTYEPAAEKMLAKLTDLGFGDLPVCMAKTQYSLSDDQTKLGRPEGFNIHVRDAFVNAGAGFVVILTGAIMTMPGLPKKPAAFGIDVDDNGKITGLF